MGWLERLFAFGRLGKAPRGQDAGRALPPASVQRTQLGLAEVDLPRGVVKLRSGEARCLLRVAGYPVHHRSAEDARAWLTGYARALNTLPGGAVLLVRSRPGGLERHVGRQGHQAAALARREPGGALARLAADQVAHARRLMHTGAVRKTDTYVALRSPKGDVARLLEVARAVAAHLRAAGVETDLVTDRALAAAIADSWLPSSSTEHFTQDFGTGEDALTLVYSPGGARVTTPRYVSLPDRGPARAALPRRDGAALPRGDGKALPR
jgi:hypothetical protein